MSEPAEQAERAQVPGWQQWLLPGELRDQGAGRSPRDWLVDTLCFLVAILLGLILLGETEDQHSEFEMLLEVVFGLAACCALWLRRRHPFGVAIATALPSVVLVAPGAAGLLASFLAMIRVPPRQIAAIALLGVVTSFTIPELWPTEDYRVEVVFGVLVTALVVIAALFVRVQRQLFASLREQTTRLESEQRLRVEQARDAERRRIASEMHDVLAHRIALLSLHAGALEFRPDAPPQEIAEAAGVVRASARAALQDLREVIGVLREQEGDGEPEPPQPTLAQIPALVERSRAAGMRIACTVDLDGVEPARIGDALGRTAFRIVQEGLTNAHKHAPAAAVEVSVTARAERLDVTVLSRRPLGAPAAAASTAAAGTTAAAGLPGSGVGLVGLGERVALAGGELRHGPDANGDFLLAATLPVSG